MGILRTDKLSGLEAPTAVTGSVLFDGTDDYLDVSNSNDFDFDASLTFELFFNLNSLPETNVLFGRGGGNTSTSWDTSDGAQFALYVTTSGVLTFEYNSSGTPTPITSSSGAITLNTWYHVAVAYDGSTFTLYLDGVNQGTDTSTPTMPTTRNIVRIGMWPTSDNVQETRGYISNLRVLKGTALYTSDFTPPVHELQPIGDTVLLCCNNPDSAGAASYAGIGTSKTITVNGDAAASTFSPGLTRDFTSGTEFKGVTTFDTQGYFVPPSGTTEQRFPTNFGVGSGRGVFMGGIYPGNVVDTIDYVTIPTLGNAQDFGNLSEVKRLGGAFSSSTRAVAAGGFLDPANTNAIEYVTIASTGDSKDFGDLTSNLKRANGGLANSTRGISFGGTPNTTVEFTTIASMGNAVRFGSLLTGGAQKYGSASSTRGLMAGGETPSLVKSIDMITIASTGDAIDFGDLTDNTSGHCAVSSPTRIVFVGGEQPSPVGFVNVMEFVTTAALGNATNFGDLSSKRRQSGTASSSTRGIIAGGGNDTPASNTAYNTIDYITISTTGDSQDFGDLSQARWQIFNGTVSDSHGGLS